MKNLNNIYGRSMIEMLGVFAIIGVLSVGGIAGYTKAMYKNDLNKLIKQISHIAMNIQTLFLTQEDFSGLPISYASGLAAAGIIEDDMVGNVLYWNNVVTLPFGGAMWLETAWVGPCDEPPYDMPECSLKIRRSYSIQMYNLPDRVVKDLMTYDWSVIDGFYGFDTYDGDIDSKLCAIDRDLTNYCSAGLDNYIGTNAYKEGNTIYIFHYPDENGHLQMPAPISITSQMNTEGNDGNFKLTFSY